MTSIIMAVMALALLSAARMADGDSVAERIKRGVDALFGAPSTAPTATPQGAGVTLRYSTLSRFVPESEYGGRNIGELFEAYSSDLGGVELGSNTTIRDTHPSQGGVVEEACRPVSGRTYVASVRKEDKGN